MRYVSLAIVALCLLTTFVPAETFLLTDGSEAEGLITGVETLNFVLKRDRGRVFIDRKIYDLLPAGQKALVDVVAASYKVNDVKAEALRLKREPRTFHYLVVHFNTGESIPLLAIDKKDRPKVTKAYNALLAERKRADAQAAKIADAKRLAESIESREAKLRNIEERTSYLERKMNEEKMDRDAKKLREMAGLE